MGFVASTVALSRETLGNVGFQSWFERPGFLTFKDLPYLPPPFVPLMDKTQQIIEATQEKVERSHDAGFVNRTQSGWFAWAGPPGAPENRPQHSAPEESGGSVFNWFA